MTGTLLNVAAVVAGSLVGLLVGSRIPEHRRKTVMQGLGLVVLLIGMRMAFGTTNVLIVLGSVALGAVVGEWIDLEARLEALGRFLEVRAGKLARLPEADRPNLFAQAFVTASLVYCVGPMTIVGSIQDGLTGDYSTLAVKSMLDGIASVVLAASLGIGVLFSALTVLIYQGALTVAAALVRSAVSDAMIAEMTAAGGVLILGIGLNLLELARVRVGNLLPALVFAPAIVAIGARWAGG